MDIKLETVISWLDEQYPASLAEEWDNVGFLVGFHSGSVGKIMTCLTVTPNVVDEAIREKIDLIVSHHPFPFRPVKRITSANAVGTMLLSLIRSDIALYSPHTAHDSAPDGINQQLALLLELDDVQPLYPNGSGRIGHLPNPIPLSDILQRVKTRLGPSMFVGSPRKMIARIALGCGAADGFVADSAKQGADLLLLGEARFHACLEAESLGLALILPGHYASERFAVETLAAKIAARFPEISCHPSRSERDVIQWS